MDGAYQVDIDALLDIVRGGDHLIVRFATVAQRLFIDFRTSAEDGPGVHLLPAVESMHERLATIAEARPRFPRPERLRVVAWPLRVAGIERLGLLAAMRERLAAMDAFREIRALDEVYRALVAAEREEVRRAITGEGYRTLWAGAAGR